jgi:hypothetical protein
MLAKTESDNKIPMRRINYDKKTLREPRKI